MAHSTHFQLCIVWLLTGRRRRGKATFEEMTRKFATWAHPSPPPSLYSPTSSTMSVYAQPEAGFSFENSLRNTSLANKNLGLPKATSTGTTIVGCLYENGIVLGADTRATEGPIVADKNCEKVNSTIPTFIILLSA